MHARNHALAPPAAPAAVVLLLVTRNCNLHHCLDPQECMSNPAAMAKYQNDPVVSRVIEKIGKIMGGAMGGMGGMGGGFGALRRRTDAPTPGTLLILTSARANADRRSEIETRGNVNHLTSGPILPLIYVPASPPLSPSSRRWWRRRRSRGRGSALRRDRRGRAGARGIEACNKRQRRGLGNISGRSSGLREGVVVVAGDAALEEENESCSRWWWSSAEEDYDSVGTNGRR